MSRSRHKTTNSNNDDRTHLELINAELESTCRKNEVSKGTLKIEGNRDSGLLQPADVPVPFLPSVVLHSHTCSADLLRRQLSPGISNGRKMRSVVNNPLLWYQRVC